jgi:hypothetical protein
VEPVFFPRGVADPEGRAGYVGDGRGIVAVDIPQGQQLWRTERSAHPLISDGTRLAAASPDGHRANVLEVVIHDGSRQGDPVLVSDPVVFPEWATAGPGPREVFWMRAQLDDNKLRLEWEARARYSGGAAPSARIRREAEHDATGVVEVDLDTGSVERMALDADAAESPVRRPPLEPQDLDEAWLAGTVVTRLVWDTENGEQKLSLETIDPSTGSVRAALDLARGGGLVAQVTPDGCYLLVHSEIRTSQDDPWSVFSAQTGERVATLAHEAGATSPAILRDRVFYLVEQRDAGTVHRTLRARELDAGGLIWELPLATEAARPVRRLRQ